MISYHKLAASTVIAFAVVLVGYAQTYILSYESDAAKVLKLTVATDRDQYLIGQPVHAAVRLINNGHLPVLIYDRLDPIAGDLILFVSKERDGEYRQYRGPWTTLDVAYRAKVLLP